MTQLINLLNKHKIFYSFKSCFIVVSKKKLPKHIYNKILKTYYIEENNLSYLIYISDTKPQKSHRFFYVIAYLFYFFDFIRSKLLLK